MVLGLVVAASSCGGTDGGSGPGGSAAPSTTTSSTPVTTPKPPSDQTAPKSTFGLAYHEGRLWVADFYGSQVLGVDPEAKRISLSIRAVLEAERKDAAETEKTDDGAEAVAVDVEAVGKQMEEEAQADEQE